MLKRTAYKNLVVEGLSVLQHTVVLNLPTAGKAATHAHLSKPMPTPSPRPQRPNMASERRSVESSPAVNAADWVTLREFPIKQPESRPPAAATSPPTHLFE